jgi:hypothetical protein
MGWFDQALQTVRLAGQNPVVRAILGATDRIPVALNPLKTRTPTTSLGKLGKATNPLNPSNAALIGVSALARQFLPPEDAQRIEYFGFGTLPGIALNVLDAGAVGASEDQELQRYKAQYLQRANAEAAAKTNLGAPTPAPAAGNRVDAATPQIGNRQAAPVQTPTVPQFTEASLRAADAGYEAPANVPLGQFYAAQQALGRNLEQTGELQRRLKESGAAAGMSDAALMAWAQKNPGLAYREMVNRESRGGLNPVAN